MVSILMGLGLLSGPILGGIQVGLGLHFAQMWQFCLLPQKQWRHIIYYLAVAPHNLLYSSGFGSHESTLVYFGAIWLIHPL